MHIYMVNITCINSIYGIKEGFKLNWQCSSRKYPYSPHRKDWKFLGGGGVLKGPKIYINVWSLTGISREVGRSKEKSLPWGKYGTTHWMRHCQWEPLAFSLIGFECNQSKVSCQGKQYITTKTLSSSQIVHEKFAIWYKLQHHTWSPTLGS